MPFEHVKIIFNGVLLAATMTARGKIRQIGYKGNEINIRGFHKYTTLAIMPILVSEALLQENKKIQRQNVTPSGNRTTGPGF